MKVELTYFKRNGKYYTHGNYETEEIGLLEIWDEIKAMKADGKQPGLVDGATEFIVLVDVPDHPYRHPHLIL